jgi:hypothetical protein
MLIDKISLDGGSSWLASAARYTNGTGTMLASAADAASGEALSDVYTLTASAVSGGTATITVTTSSPNNPFSGRVATGVALDGATIYDNIVPGVLLVFSNTTANGNVSTVTVGVYGGTFDAFGVGAGVPSAATRHQVLNNGTGAVADAVAQLLAHSVLYKKVGAGIFSSIKPFAPGATEKVLGGGSTRTEPYHMTVANVTGSGSAKVADLLVDGTLLGAASVLDITTGATQTGAALKAIVNYPYRIVSGPLTGVEFNISPSVANTDTANILIFPARYVQIAPDSAGSPGTWGTSDVTLTQAGQSAGVILPSGVAYYHSRIVVPAGAGSESNPHPGDVALAGTETGIANWAG